MPTIINQCPCCQSSQSTQLTQPDHREIVSCSQCGHHFCRQFSGEELTRLYKDMYYKSPDDPRIEAWANEHKAVWDGLCKLVPQNSQKLLDVGSGSGGFLLRANHHRPELKLAAVESSSAACESLKKRIQGLQIVAESAEDLARISDNSYDFISLLQVLEHLGSPLDSLKEIRRILKPGGKFLITVPNRKSYLVKRKGLQEPFCYGNPTHLHFFHCQGLEKILKAAGFSQTERISSWGDHPSLLKNIAQWSMRKMAISSELRYICRK